MTDKADTTGLEYLSPEWFRTCALIEEGRRAGRVIELSASGSERWAEINSSPGWGRGIDYRLKPEPRVVWVVFDAVGEVFGCYPDKPYFLRQGHNLIRFVELPE